VVPEVRAAAAWYAQVFDGQIEKLDDDRARIGRGNGIALELRKGTPNPHPSTPVLEIVVDDLPSWLDPALRDGATRMTPESLRDYAQFRDPYGYVWAFRDRAAIPPWT
jgi:uncharacterized glyoxalase superfamily protein PhnB